MGSAARCSATAASAAAATATGHVYAALTVVAALTFAGALLIMPRRFSTTAGESASTGPAQSTPGQKTQ